MTKTILCRTLFGMSFHVRQLQQEKRSRLKPLYRFLAASLTMAKPIHGWYLLWSKRNAHQKTRKKRVVMLKKMLLILISVLTVCILIAATVRGMVSMGLLNIGTVTSIAGAELPRDQYNQFNVLLLGQGDADHDGKDLTDTIIIASLDPDISKSAVLVSLPRDTYFLHTEKMAKGKLNSFYRDYKSHLIYQEGIDPEDAPAEALKEIGNEIGRKLGIEIHHTVNVNFSAFIEAVDAVDGINIDVPYDIKDTQYPDNEYGFETFELLKGEQKLDGITALKYARSRHTTSDFSRSARQQQLIGAMAKKVKEEGHITDTSFIASMLQNLSKNMESTMSLREMIGLASLAKNIDRNRIITMQFNDRNALYDGFIEPGGFLYAPPRNLFNGTAVLLPVSIPEFPVTWEQPKAFIKLLTNARKVYLNRPVLNILNNGAAPGSARKLATELIRYGFSINDIANADLESKQDKSILFGNNESKEILEEFFKSILNIENGLPPEGLPIEQQEDITIILGKDFNYQPIKSLL
jgi:polyisoprenyl-teichoic acid--peptidoglycan teichoic acid transferase